MTLGLARRTGWSLARGLAFSLLFAPAQNAAAASCVRLAIANPRPLWISSAAFVASLDRVGVVDPLRNSLLLINPRSGESEVFRAKALVSLEKEMVPATLNQTREGFVLAMVDQRLYWLDRELRLTGVAQRPKATAGAPRTIISAYDTVVTGTYFFSIGVTKTKDGRFRSGVFRAPLPAPGNSQILRGVPDSDYYLVGHKYLAGTEAGLGYAVLMGGKAPVIAEFSQNGRERLLDLIPAAYKRVPKLKSGSASPNTDQAVFREIESLSIPVGLYSQDNLLYLLTREPKRGVSGRTQWHLTQVDPETARVLGSMELPTSAHHLTVVNTPENWYFFEKGEVQPNGAQAIPSILVIPSLQIKARSIPSECAAAAERPALEERHLRSTNPQPRRSHTPTVSRFWGLLPPRSSLFGRDRAGRGEPPFPLSFCTEARS